ncbi:MAG: GAF domain-containing protein [Acidobacteriota bacterium]|nr:GAF domain-containing protein [Acidobacteriota bacterium]
MPARLTLHLPFQPAKVFFLEDQKTYVLGRDSDCELAVQDDRISRRHASLAHGEAGWVLEDLGSKNGTLLNGAKAVQEVLARQAGESAWLSFGGVVGKFDALLKTAEGAWTAEQSLRWQTSVRYMEHLDPGAGLDLLLETLMDSVIAITGTERGFILLRSPEGGLELVKATGVPASDLESASFAGSLGAVERALEQAVPVVVSDTQSDEFLRDRASILEGSIRTLICLPLRVFGRVIGAVYADSPKTGTTFTELDVQMLEAVVSQAAIALWAARLNEEIQGLMGSLAEHSTAGEVSVEALHQELVESRARLHASYGTEPGDEPRAGEGSLKRAWKGIVQAFQGNGHS